MVRCYNCSSRTTLHCIPKNPKTRQKWKKLIPDLKEANFNKFLKLCSLHFEPNQLFYNGKLFWNAVPTRFKNNEGIWYTVAQKPKGIDDSDSDDDQCIDGEIDLPETDTMRKQIASIETPNVAKCFNCAAENSLHYVPTIPKIQEKWKKIIPNSENAIFDTSFKLCSNHFASDVITKCGKLLCDAVPTKFMSKSGTWYTISNKDLEMEEPDKERKNYKTYGNKKRLKADSSSDKEKTTEQTMNNNKTEKEADVIKMTIRTNKEQKEEEEAAITPRNPHKSICLGCNSKTKISEQTLYWETQKYCNEKCLEMHQLAIGLLCTTCQKDVHLDNLGKFCTRFDNDLKQFCSIVCANSYLNKFDIPCFSCQSPLLNKNSVKTDDFCSSKCLKNYEASLVSKKFCICAVCNSLKVGILTMDIGDQNYVFCSMPCFSAFKFVQNLQPDECKICSKYFTRKTKSFTIFQEGRKPTLLCSKFCMKIFIVKQRHILQCRLCKMQKYNFCMIQKKTGGKMFSFCTLNCIKLNKNPTVATSTLRNACHQCKILRYPSYILKKKDGSTMSFCSLKCLKSFQLKVSEDSTKDVSVFKILQTGPSKTIKEITKKELELIKKSGAVKRDKIILYKIRKTTNNNADQPAIQMPTTESSEQPKETENLEQINLETSNSEASVSHVNIATMCQPKYSKVECETDFSSLYMPMPIALPVPIYVPVPMHVYSMPVTTPIPMTIPLPVPICIPTNCNLTEDNKKIKQEYPPYPLDDDELGMFADEK